MVNKQQSLLNAGKSISQRLWEELDRIMDILMVEGEPSINDYFAPEADENGQDIAEMDRLKADVQQWGEHRGNAQGVAYAIAMMYSPYSPNVPHIKELAMQRWNDRNAK